MNCRNRFRSAGVCGTFFFAGRNRCWTAWRGTEMGARPPLGWSEMGAMLLSACVNQTIVRGSRWVELRFQFALLCFGSQVCVSIRAKIADTILLVQPIPPLLLRLL